MNKECRKCNKVLNIKCFNNNKSNSDGLQSYCKGCNRKRRFAYCKTKKGFCANIYSRQREKSKLRGHHLPSYSCSDLKNWLFSQELFHLLFDAWEISWYDKNLAPSIDRKNSLLPYTMANLQLMTWQENNKKEHYDVKCGNSSKCKVVQQYTKDGSFIAEYKSTQIAKRITGISKVSSCASGKRNTAGGYIWKYKEMEIIL